MQRRMRGQAALEYLATYGWALLAIFLALAYLVNSGIFDPGRFVPDECVFASNIPCGSGALVRAKSDGHSEIYVNFTNGMGYPIYIKNYTVRFRTAAGGYSFGDPAFSRPEYWPILVPIEAYVSQGGTYLIRSGFSKDANINREGSQTFYVTFSYRSCNDARNATTCKALPESDYPYHQTSGRIVARIRQQ